METKMRGLKSYITDTAQHIGTAVMPDLLDDEKYRETIEAEFNSVVVEHHMKWEPLCSRGECIYDFTAADKIVDWAVSHQMNVKAHTLIWHVTTPSWLGEKSPAAVKEAMRRHIYTTAAHFRGRVHSWDVVNEALAPDGTLANNVFYEKLGKEYIAESFRWAREADPNVKLIYNDNKVEGLIRDEELASSEVSYCSEHSRKSNAMYALVKELKEANVPIDEVGFQGHFNCAGVELGRPPTPASIQRNMKRYEELGLTVNMSEIDIRISQLPEEVDGDVAQSQLYRDTVQACYSEKAFTGMTFWGFTDKHTWVHQFYGNDRPLLWNEEYKKKPAYFAVVEGLQNAGKPVEADWNSWMQPEPAAKSGITAAGCAKPDWEVA